MISLLKKILDRIKSDSPQIKELVVVNTNGRRKIIGDAKLTKYNDENFELEYGGRKMICRSEEEARAHLKEVYQTRYGNTKQIEIRGSKYKTHKKVLKT